MDNKQEITQPITNTPPSFHEAKARYFQKLRNPWIIGGVGVLLVILISFLLPTAQKKAPSTNSSPRKSNQASESIQQRMNITPQPTLSNEMIQALSEAKKTDQESDRLEINTRAQYPWIRKLPFTDAGKYFVYFDTNKKSFIGKLYPGPGDNVDQLKAAVINKLKSSPFPFIPVDNYPLIWIITPQP